MLSHSVNQLYNFIGGWYNDTTLIDQLIKFHKDSPDKLPGKVTAGVDKSIKQSTDVMLSGDIIKEYSNYLQKSIDEYIKEYPFCNHYSPFKVIQAANVQHYKPNEGFVAWHTERAKTKEPHCSRHLVFMTYLNTVTDGGETEFFHQKIKIKPEKGLTLIWPADWTFTHRGITSPTQEKYIITGWLNYVE